LNGFLVDYTGHSSHEGKKECSKHFKTAAAN